MAIEDLDWEFLYDVYKYQDNQEFCEEIAQDYLDKKIDEQAAKQRVKELSINSLKYFIDIVREK